MSEGEAKVRELADRYWEELLEIEPLLGTEVGDERFDDRLGDPSEAGLERSRHLQQRTLDALGQVEVVVDLDSDAVDQDVKPLVGPVGTGWRVSQQGGHRPSDRHLCPIHGVVRRVEGSIVDVVAGGQSGEDGQGSQPGSAPHRTRARCASRWGSTSPPSVDISNVHRRISPRGS